MRIPLFQELINILRNKVVDLDIFIAKACVMENFPNAKTIFLGSSHGKNGFRTDESSINIALASQDLYYSYHLYKKYNNKSLKNIVVSYSVFSSGYQIIKTLNNFQSLLYKLVFGIDYQFLDIARERKMCLREPFYAPIVKRALKEAKIDKNYRGQEEKYSASKKFLDESYIEKMVKSHIKNNNRENNQIDYVGKMIELAKENNHNLIFVITPHSKKYRKYIQNEENLFEKLYKKVCEAGENDKNIKILNYFSDPRFQGAFEQEFFLDSDHLNLKGAELLTSLVFEEGGIEK